MTIFVCFARATCRFSLSEANSTKCVPFDPKMSLKHHDRQHATSTTEIVATKRKQKIKNQRLEDTGFCEEKGLMIVFQAQKLVS